MSRKAKERCCQVCRDTFKRTSANGLDSVCGRCKREVDNQTLEALLGMPAEALAEMYPEDLGSVHARGCRQLANEDLDCSCGAIDPDETPELDFNVG